MKAIKKTICSYLVVLRFDCLTMYGEGLLGGKRPVKKEKWKNSLWVRIL